MPSANFSAPVPPPGGEPFEVSPGVTVERAALRFAFSSSSGPGGQNVNKRATKAELRVAVREIPLPPDALRRLRALAGRRMTESDDLVLTCDEHRSQARNRAACLERLRVLLVRAATRPRPRRPTHPTRASVERRLTAKRSRAERKRRRNAPDD